MTRSPELRRAVCRSCGLPLALTGYRTHVAHGWCYTCYSRAPLAKPHEGEPGHRALLTALTVAKLREAGR